LPTSSDHYVVQVDEVIAIHGAIVAEFGGRKGIRDRALVEAAVGRPYTGYYPSIEEKGAALLQSLACNHGFVDGNKRTALVTLNLLLVQSGFRFPANDIDQQNKDAEKMVLDLVEHRIKLDEVVAWIKRRIIPV
jgi:death-on-curing protein